MNETIGVGQCIIKSLAATRWGECLLCRSFFRFGGSAGCSSPPSLLPVDLACATSVLCQWSTSSPISQHWHVDPTVNYFFPAQAYGLINPKLLMWLLLFEALWCRPPSRPFLPFNDPFLPPSWSLPLPATVPILTVGWRRAMAHLAPLLTLLLSYCSSQVLFKQLNLAPLTLLAASSDAFLEPVFVPLLPSLRPSFPPSKISSRISPSLASRPIALLRGGLNSASRLAKYFIQVKNILPTNERKE